MDEIVRMLAGDGHVKAIALTGSDLVERARNIHKTLPVGTAALGRTLMAASMLGADLKVEDGSITLQIAGGGPLGGVTAVADFLGNVRGFVQNGAVDLPLKGPAKLDVGTAVGSDGFITVIKDLNLKEPYIGRVKLVSGEIAEDLTAYLADSEQIPSACALGVLVDVDQSVLAAGGYILQLLPGAPEGMAEQLESAVAALGPVTSILAEGVDAEQMLRLLLVGLNPQLLARSEIAYHCPCNRARVSKALISLGREELQSLIDEAQGAELTCQFCDKVNNFTTEQLQELLEEATRVS